MNGMHPVPNGILTERTLEWFHHDSISEWGYTHPQTDTFAVLHPAADCKAESYPLYVVFHSAGHDVYSCVACTWRVGNHDIYHAPRNMYALYLDCRQHENDWWWGGNTPFEVFDEKRDLPETQPVEKRCIDTIRWVMEHYPIDADRVYAVGNSMGGSGALGVCMNRGDLFAAVKANVPAGVRHMAARCGFDSDSPVTIPDPPVLVDYSAQNDTWSAGHESLYRNMRERKYAVMGYWGNFGHANDNVVINKVNDLVHSFDLFSIRRCDPYPVFTNASTDDELPWDAEDKVLHDRAGQINSFFRWGKALESENSVSIPLRLLRADEWESRVVFPEASVADVTLRRLQIFRAAPGAKVEWTFGTQSGEVTADEAGLVTVPGVEIGTEVQTLTLHVEK